MCSARDWRLVGAAIWDRPVKVEWMVRMGAYLSEASKISLKMISEMRKVRLY